MPILNPNYDPLLKRLKLPTATLQSSLPNPFDADTNFIGGSSERIDKQWALTKGDNWAVGSQLQAGNVLASVGAPAGTDLFRGLTDIVRVEDPVLEFRRWVEQKIKSIARALLEELVELVSKLAQEFIDGVVKAVGSIPIYGWILESIYDVINGIVLVVKIFKAQRAPDPEAEYNAAMFNPTTDRDMANLDILDLMRTGPDWTSIFKPRGIGRNKTYGERFWSAKLKGDMGRRIITTGSKQGWVGYIPGTSTIDQGWEITKYGTRNLGSLLPTSRDMAMLCWSQVDGGSNKGRSGSPSMFTVDADGAMRAWSQFLFDFRIWLREGETGMNKSARKKFVDGPGKDLYGWSNWDTKFDDKKGYDNFGINNSNPVKELRRLRKRQYAFLNRIDVAYVGPGYGVLKGVHSDDIRNRWDENRRRLLKHVARCNVDITNIPDSNYKLEMENAQKNCIPQHIGTLTSRPGDKLVPGAEDPPPPGKPIITTDILAVKRLVKAESDKHRRSKGKKGNLMLIGLGVGLIALAARGRK